MGKKKKSCTCYECEITFDVTITSSLNGESTSKLEPQLCPFCGDSVDLDEPRPFLKDFDEYDEFDDDKYYSDEDEDE
jgi:hypothetical protein